MDKTKNYSLFPELIGDAIADFVGQDHSLSWTFSAPSSTQHVFRISRGSDTGVITFYFKKTGLVSINIQGGLNDICDNCCDYVISRTTIPNSQRKSFVIRECWIDNYEYFKTDLSDQHNYMLTNKDTNNNVQIEEILTVEDANGVKVITTLYKNGTFLLQGNVTPVYVKVMTEAVSWLMDAGKAANVDEVISLNNITNTFDTNIDVLIPNLNVCGDTDNVIKRMVITSVTLLNSGVKVDDYGCFTFGILKAMEGILKLRLEVDLGMVDKLGDYFWYDPTTHSHRISTIVYDGNPRLKVAINKTYNYWISRRHSSFHADAQISTSTLYSYEDAVEIGMKALECINEVCDNW